MISNTLQRQLSLLLIRSGMKGKYAIVDAAETHNITMMQAYTLCLLEPGQAVPMKSLSSFISCDPSNITVIVEQLVNVGLVERKEALHDRRVKTVSLTEKGLKLRDTFLDLTAETRLPNLESLTSEEAQALISLLEQATTTSATESVSKPVAV